MGLDDSFYNKFDLVDVLGCADSTEIRDPKTGQVWLLNDIDIQQSTSPQLWASDKPESAYLLKMTCGFRGSVVPFSRVSVLMHRRDSMDTNLYLSSANSGKRSCARCMKLLLPEHGPKFAESL
jgi:hypothetical protein